MAKKNISSLKENKVRKMTKLVIFYKSIETGLYSFKEKMIDSKKVNDFINERYN